MPDSNRLEEALTEMHRRAAIQRLAAELHTNAIPTNEEFENMYPLLSRTAIEQTMTQETI